MKKLESLKCEKFRISDEELLQVKGGYGVTNDYSYTYSTTNTNGQQYHDSTVTDACVDW